MKTKTEKNKSLLKKALITTLVVVVPGGTLLGRAYLLSKKGKAKQIEASRDKAG